MKTKKAIKKVAAVSLAIALALSVSPVAKMDAKAKKPSISKSSLTIKEGGSKTLTIKKNKTTVKSVKWTSTKKKVATVSVNKKNKLKATVKAKKAGNATIKAAVKYKNGKKTKSVTLKCKVKVKADESIQENVWITASNPEVESGVSEIFNKINEDVVGVTYKPFATLAYKFSDEGTSWRVFSQENLVTPDMPSMYVIAEVTERLDGTVYLQNVFASTQECFPDGSSPTVGNWQQCESPVIDQYAFDAFEGMGDLPLGVTYTPVAKVASKVENTIKYCILCETKTVTSEPETGYALLYLNTDATAGTAILEEINNIFIDGGIDESSRYNNSIFLRNGAELKDVYLAYVGNGYYNAKTIYANNTEEPVEVDPKKFEFEFKDGTKFNLNWGIWTLPTKTPYIYRASSLQKAFNDKLNVGDEIKIFYDGELIRESSIVIDESLMTDRLITGGWEAAESPEIDNYLKAAVEKAGEEYSNLYTIVPMALLATRQTEGQQYRVFCKFFPTGIVGFKGYYGIIDLYENLIGESVISAITIKNMEAYGTGNVTGFNETESPVYSKAEGLYFEKAFEGLDGVEHKPLAILATEAIRGTNYCFIEEATVISPTSLPSYNFVYFSVDEEGNVSYEKTVEIADA
ncbi:MAG: Ig-like domain-containing protein [Eubacterium sp.]|nr:Ig-like domain-containing protein [Eubacterium sp.]